MKTTKNNKLVVVTQSHYSKIDTSLNIMHLPIITFEKFPIDKNKLSGHFDWVVITSKNTVEFFKEELLSLSYKKIASIGKTTTKALRDNGFKVDFEPSTYTQEGFMEEFNVEKDARILYPASNEKRPLMRDFMKSRGADVVEIDLYHPIGDLDSIDKIKRNLDEIDAITFSSPSGVHIFMEHFNKNILERMHVVSIGHVTKSALDKYDVRSITPEVATLESMIRVLEEEYNNEI